MPTKASEIRMCWWLYAVGKAYAMNPGKITRTWLDELQDVHFDFAWQADIWYEEELGENVLRILLGHLAAMLRLV